MKKYLSLCVICMLLLTNMPVTHALFGGGISGPLPVFNTNPTVDLATITTQINTLKQLEAALKNLSSMDASSAAANQALIQQNLQQLVQMQQQTEGLVMDYTNFQTAWDEQYQDFSAYSGMSGAEYADNAQRLLQAMNQSIYNAMRSQGLVSQTSADAATLQQLMQASQSAEGALAAAQAGNQIAAMQAQSLMKLQQTISQSNRAQSEWLAYQTHKEAMAKEASANFLNTRDNE